MIDITAIQPKLAELYPFGIRPLPYNLVGPIELSIRELISGQIYYDTTPHWILPGLNYKRY